MRENEVLKELFDEKIVRIINLFLDNPDERFSLTQVSSLSKVNVATTFRILDKLIKKDFVELVVIGKSKFYKQKQSEKTMLLNKFLNKDERLLEFVDKIKIHPRIKKIILEEKNANGAKLLIVGDFLPTEKINALVEEIRQVHNFRIQYMEMPEKQFEDLQKLGLYGLQKKVIWQRN